MDGDHAPLAAEVDDALHERQLDDGARRVVRERQHEDPRLRPADVVGGREAVEELVGEALALLRVGERAHRHLAEVGPREQWAVDVDGVARARHDRRIAAVEQHPHQVAEALLRADRVGDLELRIELDAPRLLVVAGDRLAQLGQAAAQRVAVVRRLRGSLGELLHGDVRRRDVRVAEAQVDDVPACPTCLDLQVVDDREDVRRQVLDSPELHACDATRRPRPTGASEPPPWYRV